VYNEDAMVILVAKRVAINSAINDMNEYTAQVSDWLSGTKTRQMTKIKASAGIAGADIDAWDGTATPPKE
jgi:predicted ATP-grasp superfamily ATP-dependent carboligase